MKRIPILEQKVILFHELFYDNDKNYDKNCIMIEVNNIPLLKEIHSQITREMLYTEEENDNKGLEMCSHITILFGINPDIKLSTITNYLPSISEFGKIKINGISIFEKEEYDVLKFDIENELLTKTFTSLVENIPNSNEYPEYHGHITIAYLKKGFANKFIRPLMNSYTYATLYRYSSGVEGSVQRFII